MNKIYDHLSNIFYFIRTGQFYFFRCDFKFLGPRYVYYDGPHYAFGFWWFAFSMDDHKDAIKRESMWNLIDLFNKLK